MNESPLRSGAALLLATALAACEGSHPQAKTPNADAQLEQSQRVEVACTQPDSMSAHARDAIRAAGDVSVHHGTLGDLRILTEQCSNTELDIAIARSRGTAEGDALSEIRDERGQ